MWDSKKGRTTMKWFLCLLSVLVWGCGPGPVQYRSFTCESQAGDVHFVVETNMSHCEVWADNLSLNLRDKVYDSGDSNLCVLYLTSSLPEMCRVLGGHVVFDEEMSEVKDND